MKLLQLPLEKKHRDPVAPIRKSGLRKPRHLRKQCLKEGGGGVAAQEGAQEGKGGGVAAQEGAQEGKKGGGVAAQEGKGGGVAAQEGAQEGKGGGVAAKEGKGGGVAAKEGKGGGVAAQERAQEGKGGGWAAQGKGGGVAAQEGKGGQVPWDQWNDPWTSSDWDTWSTWSYSQQDWQEPPQTQWEGSQWGGHHGEEAQEWEPLDQK